jgi:hypothetical protein
VVAPCGKSWCGKEGRMCGACAAQGVQLGQTVALSLPGSPAPDAQRGHEIEALAADFHQLCQIYEHMGYLLASCAKRLAALGAANMVRKDAP